MLDTPPLLAIPMLNARELAKTREQAAALQLQDSYADLADWGLIMECGYIAPGNFRVVAARKLSHLLWMANRAGGRRAMDIWLVDMFTPKVCHMVDNCAVWLVTSLYTVSLVYVYAMLLRCLCISCVRCDP